MPSEAQGVSWRWLDGERWGVGGWGDTHPGNFADAPCVGTLEFVGGDRADVRVSNAPFLPRLRLLQEDRAIGSKRFDRDTVARFLPRKKIAVYHEFVPFVLPKSEVLALRAEVVPVISDHVIHGAARDGPVGLRRGRGWNDDSHGPCCAVLPHRQILEGCFLVTFRATWCASWRSSTRAQRRAGSEQATR